MEENNNSIFFRVNNTIYTKMNRIRDTYGFRSNAELARTIVRVFVNLYGQKRKTRESIEDEIANEFKALETGDKMFDFTKPKKEKKYPKLD